MLTTFGQSNIETELAKIKADIKKNLIYGHKTYHESIVDIDNDGDNDYLFLSERSESKDIQVFINNNNHLEKQIEEFCHYYSLYNNGNQKRLSVIFRGCCGDHYSTSNKVYDFEKDKAVLIENYSEFNEMIVPKFFLDSPYQVTIINNDYNLRYIPNIEKVEEREYSKLEKGTNIIATLQSNTSAKVLSEIVEDENRKWLYVEIDPNELSEKKSDVSLFNKEQKTRGWISGKFVRKK